MKRTNKPTSQRADRCEGRDVDDRRCRQKATTTARVTGYQCRPYSETSQEIKACASCAEKIALGDATRKDDAERADGRAGNDLRSVAAKACDEWLDGPEGVRAQDAWTLLGSNDPDRYLRNRLQRAFLAGMEAALPTRSPGGGGGGGESVNTEQRP